MPLPMKSLSQASAELGISEAEMRALADMKKIRSVVKKGALTFAPDEIARLKRQRKTMLESAYHKNAPAATPAPAAAKPGAPKKFVPPKRTPMPPKMPGAEPTP